MDEILEEYGLSVFLGIVGGMLIEFLINLLNQFTVI